MLHAVLVLASENHRKIPFFICGGVLAAWAVLLSALGLSSAEFPGSETGSRAVMAISVVLVAAAMTSAIATH